MENLFQVPYKLLHLDSVCKRLRNVRLFARSSLRILCWPSWVLSRWMGLQQSRCAPKVRNPSLQIALLYLLFANWQYIANICNFRSCAAFSRCHKRQICAKLENLLCLDRVPAWLEKQVGWGTRLGRPATAPTYSAAQPASTFHRKQVIHST